jgi:outer membrane protein OmpA-like peptidoglycan-associated protein
MRGAVQIAWLTVIGVVFAGCSTVSVELVSLSGAKITAVDPSPSEVVVEQEAPAPVRVSDNKITIDETIQFVTWSAKLLEDSYGILDEVAKVLSENEAIKRVEIQGHTARTGQTKRSMKLSVDRAKAVREYLVKKGVAPDRLVAKGYGETKPVADNGTADGREKNRRVEFLIVEGAQEVALARGQEDGDEEEAR